MNKAWAAALLALVAACQVTAAPDTRVAMVSGGPHPYTASWTRAASDAARDFKLGSAGYKMPPRLDPGEQIALLESLMRQGFNAYVLFPYDTPETLKTIADMAAHGAAIVAAAGCMKDPSPAQFCLATDSSASAYTGARADPGHAGQEAPGPFHRLDDRPQHPGPHRRGAACRPGGRG